jgi:hypothetical protein
MPGKGALALDGYFTEYTIDSEILELKSFGKAGKVLATYPYMAPR